MNRQVRVLATVIALGAALFGCSSNDTTGIDTIDAPASLAAATTTATSVTVTYGAVTGATSYGIERMTGTAAFAQVGTSTTTSFTDTGVTGATTYKYRVRALSGSKTGTYSTELTVTTPAVGPKTANISLDITSNRTLFADTIYTLKGFIHVANGATLTIEPGTVIQGDFNTLGSSLFILRGAKINAVGTAAKPIVFTSSRAVGSRQAGDWGGLILVGNGIINRGATTEVEGTNTNTTGASGTNYSVIYGGGTNNADNSGTLSYVRVEFAGFAPSPDNELNSFTFAAVGSGTTMDHLQAMGGLDDAYEFFGGAVDGKYLVSYNTGDDHYDMSEGYSGRLQFIIAYQSRVPINRPGAGGASTDPQGIENDGCNGAGCGNGQASTPYTIPIIANFTLIGTGSLPAIDAANGGIGAVLRRGTGGYYVNGVLARWPKGAFSVRDTSTTRHVATNELLAANILAVENGALFQTGQLVLDSTANNVTKSTATTASLFTLFPTSPSSAADFDWTPSGNSPLRSGGMTTFPAFVSARAGGFITPTSYLGAVDPSGVKWWQGWTVYLDN